MFLLIECLETPKGDNAIIKDLGRWGRYEFRSQPEFAGRCVVEVASETHQQKVLEAGNGAGGRPLFVIPVDLQKELFRRVVRTVVEEALGEWGLQPQAAAPPMATQGTVQAVSFGQPPEHRGPGRPRKL